MVQKYTSLYKKDPTTAEQEAGIQGTDVYQGSPYALSSVPEFEGIKSSTTDYNKYSDLYNLYLGGGFDAAQDDFVTPPATTPGGEAGTGTTTGGTGTTTGGDNTYIGGGATLEDAGGVPELDGVYATDYPGEGVGDLADYPVNTDYTPPTSDPFLASGAAGGANLPEGPEGGPPGILNPATYANTGDPDLLDLAGGDAGGADGVGIIDEIKQPLSFDEKYESIEDIPVEVGVVPEAQPVDTILAPDGITYDAVTGQPIYEDLDEQASATDVVTEADLADNTSLLQKLGLPADFDVKEALLKAGMNLAAGVPITLISEVLGKFLPDQDPRVTSLDDFYSTGEGAKYMDPSSPNYIPGMENYNTVSGGGLNMITGGKYGDETTYGLQEAYQKRLETINKTLGKMTLEEYQNTDLVQRKKDIEEAMAKEKAMLDQLKYGDPEEIASGIGTADDDSESEMLETATGVNPFDTDDFDEGMDFSTTPVTGVTKPGTVLGTKAPDGTTIADMTDDVTLDDIGAHYDTTPTSTYEPPTGTNRPGGDRDPAPSAPSTPTGTNRPGGDERPDNPARPGGGADMGSVDAGIDTSGDFAGKGSGASGPAGGGGNDGGNNNGGGGCVIATHAVNSGAFTKDTKREAVRWCVKNLHRTWWGEAVRKGYRYYGQKAIEEGKVKNHYQEFKDYVAFGTGRKRNLKTAWTFIYRTIQFFIKGVIIKK